MLDYWSNSKNIFYLLCIQTEERPLVLVQHKKVLYRKASLHFPSFK